MNLRAVTGHDPRPVEGADREAAVLVPVVERDGRDHLLFTKRADHLGEHPGQMSFPGGSREPQDDSLSETALRETNEEIGLLRDEAELVGRLDDIHTVTGYAVRPFVGRISDREYVPDEGEVAEIAVLPVDELTDPTNYEGEQRDHPYYGALVVHYFHVDGYTVWGATGRIVAQFLALTTGWEPPEPGGKERQFDDDARPLDVENHRTETNESHSTDEENR